MLTPEEAWHIAHKRGYCYSYYQEALGFHSVPEEGCDVVYKISVKGFSAEEFFDQYGKTLFVSVKEIKRVTGIPVHSAFGQVYLSNYD